MNSVYAKDYVYVLHCVPRSWTEEVKSKTEIRLQQFCLRSANFTLATPSPHGDGVEFAPPQLIPRAS